MALWSANGDVLEHHLVIIFVERCPAAVFALHGKYPVNRALHRLPLVAPVRMLHAAQSQTNHRAIVHVRIKLIVKLEVPSARLALLVLDLPVADVSHLLLQNPIRALHHPRIVGRHARLSQSEQRVCRIPHGRHAGLHAERVFFFDSEFFELIQRSNHLRIVQ